MILLRHLQPIKNVGEINETPLEIETINLHIHSMISTYKLFRIPDNNIMTHYIFSP